MASETSGRSAAQDGPGHAHIGHVADGFRGTPDGMGLLPTAAAEAEVALQHAGFAAREGTGLDGIRRHAAHVMHALDASSSEAGPGKGYGLIRAHGGVVQHIEMAAAADGASDGVKTHANHVATAARSALERAEEMKTIAGHLMETDNEQRATRGAARLAELAAAILEGHDANEDGRMGWNNGEGGIAQATTHLGLMKRGEGMGG